MRQLIKKVSVGALTVVILTAPASAAENLLANPSFENTAVWWGNPGFQYYEGWLIIGGPAEFIDTNYSPSFDPQDGNYAMKLSNFNPGNGFVMAASDGHPVSPGDEVYAYAHLRTEIAQDDGPAARILKIAFFDENGIDIAEASSSKGFPDPGDGVCGAEFPGVVGDPIFAPDTPTGTWLQAKAQAIAASDQNQAVATCKRQDPNDPDSYAVVANAPPGAATVGLFLFNINFTNVASDMYFDNAFLGILQPDDDNDRIQNNVDIDPISDSKEFSDGTTNGVILSDNDGILSIDDATESNGIFIESSAAAPGTFARISVCDSLASIRITPNSAFDVTCGSVVLDVADGSEPVELAVVIGGEASYVTIPAGNNVTFDEEDESILVEPESNTADAVTLRVGSETAEPLVIVPGVALSLGYELDVKPGSDENCFKIDGNGVVPVAILGGAAAKVADIDNETISFNGLAVRQKGNGNPSCGIEDVNGDFVSDLVCHFEDDPINWSTINDNGEGELTATLFNGTQISLRDYICVMP